MCDCSSSESSSDDVDPCGDPCAEPCEQTEPELPQDLLRECKFLEVAVSKAGLNLRHPSTTPSESSASNSCLAFNIEVEKLADSPPVSDSQSTSCDCVTEKTVSTEKSSSLHTCTCTEPCESKVTYSTEHPSDGLEFTLAIIKPEAMMYKCEIERTIVDEGFSIMQRRWLKLTPEQASDFYFDDYQRDDFARLVAYMSSGPILVFAISKLDAIEEWKTLMGPEKVTDARIYAPDSIRGRFGRKGDDLQNAVHGSENHEIAAREIRFFFPDRIIGPLLNKEACIDYLWDEINDLLTQGLIKLCEEKPVEDPVTWLANWLLDNNKNGPKYL